jgi:hypothetical protein
LQFLPEEIGLRRVDHFFGFFFGPCAGAGGGGGGFGAGGFGFGASVVCMFVESALDV